MLTTRKERERAARDRAICERYRLMAAEDPAARPYRIFSALAEAAGLTSVWVAGICARGGVYEPGKRNKRQ